MVMDQDSTTCAHDPRSSDSMSCIDGGNIVGPGGDAGISGFRIVDVQNVRVGDAEPDQVPEYIMVVKMEPESPDDSLSQGETAPAETGSLPGNALQPSNGIQVKEKLNEDSLSAHEKSTTMFSKFSCSKNVETITERSVQQDQKNQCATPKEYEKKSRLDQVHVTTDPCEKTDKGTECNKVLSCSSAPQVHTKNDAMTCIHTFGQNSTQQVHMSIQTGEVDHLRPGRAPFHLLKSAYEDNNQREDPHPCLLCNESFSNMEDRCIPKGTHTGVNQYKCTLCNKSFTRRSTYNTHLQTHTSEKLYKCDVCSKSFTSSYVCRIHMRIHTGEKPYKCIICNKSFAHQSTHITHWRTHTGEKPYKCNVCNGTFSNSSTLQTHIRIHTGEKPYKCIFCTKSCSQRSGLKIHMRTHTGEKPFYCTFCSKSFSQTAGCRMHMRKHHTGEKPYKCNVYNGTFSESSNLQKHEDSHRRETV
uniref:zinc finger protein 271-like isoform X5 n=1 Tax=Myxine glutinosa TaxID=7769 RepID=UPI00358F0A15